MMRKHPGCILCHCSLLHILCFICTITAADVLVCIPTCECCIPSRHHISIIRRDGFALTNIVGCMYILLFMIVYSGNILQQFTTLLNPLFTLPTPPASYKLLFATSQSCFCIYTNIGCIIHIHSSATSITPCCFRFAWCHWCMVSLVGIKSRKQAQQYSKSNLIILLILQPWEFRNSDGRHDMCNGIFREQITMLTWSDCR